MILTCPSCGTQYVVKDGAIPPLGRQVRCAACKHSWHQEPDDRPAEEAAPADEPEVAEAEPVHEDTGQAEERHDEPAEEHSEAAAPDYETIGESEPTADDEEDESLTEATLIEPRAGPEAEQRAYEEAMLDEAPEHAPAEQAADEAAAARDDEGFSPFAYDDGGEERRRRPLVTVLILVLAVIALAALFWFFAPDAWKSRVGLATSGTSPLALVTTHMDRQRLESGNELLTVTGRVINPTGDEQPVPPLQAQLKSKTGEVVYSWTIAPPAQTLAPGESKSFNSAEVNVPPGGEEITLTLGAAKS